MSKSMRVSVEVDVHSVTCPGVWFPCKSPVYLSICFLGFHVKTKPFPAAFPLLFGDKFVFEKTFPGTSTLQHLQATLEGQPLYVELLQEVAPGHSAGAQTVLATFETSGLEFLFPYPQLRPTYTSGVDVDLLMEPTRDFPGIISPKIEASTRTHINETRHAHLDQLHDNAVTLNGIPPMDKHPHIPPCNTRPHSNLDDRDIFAWRKPDEELIDRKPSAHLVDMPPPPGHAHAAHAAHGHGPGPGPPTPPPHMYHIPEVTHIRPRSRSLPRTPPGLGRPSRPRSRGPPGHHGAHRSPSCGGGPPGPPVTGSPPGGPPPGPHPPGGPPPPPPPVQRDYGPHHPVQPPAPPPPHGPHGPPHPPHSPVTPPHGGPHPHHGPHPQPVVHPHTPHMPPEHVPLNPHPLPEAHHHHWPTPPNNHCTSGPHPPHPPPAHPPHPPHPPPPPVHHPHPPPPYHPYQSNCIDQAISCMANCHLDAHPHFPHLPASQPHLHSKGHAPHHHPAPAAPPCSGPCCYPP